MQDDDQISGDVFKNIQNDSMTLTKYNPNSNHDILQLNSVDEYSSHLDNVQNDLDSLKDLLRGDSYCFDANTLVEVSFLKDLNVTYDIRRKGLVEPFIFILFILCGFRFSSQTLIYP